MILSDDEIMAINQTAEFDSAIGYARAIEAKVIERLSDKLRDADRLDWLLNHTDATIVSSSVYGPHNVWFRYSNRTASEAKTKREAIDAAMKEMK